MLIDIYCIKVRKNTRVGLKTSRILRNISVNHKEMVSKYGKIAQVMDKDG